MYTKRREAVEILLKLKTLIQEFAFWQVKSGWRFFCELPYDDKISLYYSDPSPFNELEAKEQILWDIFTSLTYEVERGFRTSIQTYKNPKLMGYFRRDVVG